MDIKPELHVTDRQVTTNNCSPFATSFTMNGVQQAQTWPLLANAASSPSALLQSYAKLAFPDLDPQAAAQLLGAAASAEAQSSPRMNITHPSFAVPPMFIAAGNANGAPFGALAPHLMQQALAAPETNSVIIPPGTQMDASTFAAMSAAASAYQHMNGVAAACPFDFSGGARRKNATRETTSTLKAWLHEHRKNPYPTKAEKIMLAILTRMSLTQVSTWFANARRRLKKENKMNSWSSSQARGVEGRDGGAKHASGAPGSDNSACDDSDNVDFDTDSIDIDGECPSEGEPGTCQFNSVGVNADAVTHGHDHPAFRRRSLQGADGNVPPPPQAAPASAEQAGPQFGSGAESAFVRPVADKAKIWSLVDMATGTGPTPAAPTANDASWMRMPDGVPPAAQCQEFLKQLLVLSSKMHPSSDAAATAVSGAAESRAAPELGTNAANLHGDPLANMAALYPLYLSMAKQHSGSA